MMTSGIALSWKARPMKFYRCYFLSAANAIKGVAEFRCRDDTAALEHSRDLLKEQPAHQGFELWEGSRRLHREFVDAGNTATGNAIKLGK
jgi:hypothetical protein